MLEKSDKKLSSPLKLGRTLSMTFSSFESEGTLNDLCL